MEHKKGVRDRLRPDYSFIRIDIKRRLKAASRDRWRAAEESRLGLNLERRFHLQGCPLFADAGFLARAVSNEKKAGRQQAGADHPGIMSYSHQDIHDELLGLRNSITDLKTTVVDDVKRKQDELIEKIRRYEEREQRLEMAVSEEKDILSQSLGQDEDWAAQTALGSTPAQAGQPRQEEDKKEGGILKGLLGRLSKDSPGISADAAAQRPLLLEYEIKKEVEKAGKLIRKKKYRKARELIIDIRKKLENHAVPADFRQKTYYQIIALTTNMEV